MGHERPTTTLAIYTHVQSGSQERVLGASLPFRCLTKAERPEREPGRYRVPALTCVFLRSG